MDYSLSIYPTAPKEPNAFLTFVGHYLRLPSAWRLLTRMWERKLLEIKGLNQMLGTLSREEALKELSHWEFSYRVIEKYHDGLASRIEADKQTNANLLKFLQVVAATQYELASIISNLMMQGKPKSSQQHEPELMDAMIEMGMRNLLQRDRK